jgi:hypothetical protein
MNLIKIQDELNKLPPSPQSIQYLTAAAQGGNPQVPPWMALSRIGEINKEIQLSQPKAQAPSEPLNESLPKQAMQGMGVMGLAPQMQAPQMQQRPPMQAPQAPAPQQAPQMQRPQGMADGGLAGLPVDSRMFDYGSGGVVAFENGGPVVEEDDEGAGGDVSEMPTGASGYDPVANLKLLQQQAATQMKQGVRPVRTTEEIEKGLTGARDYGVGQGPVGQEYLQGLAALKAAKEAERGKQQEDIDRKERLAVAKALIAFGEGSRGQKGLGGIGAFGNSYIGSTENLMNERADLRQNAIKTDELLNEANYRVQELRRAQLKGDVAAERNADIALARIARDLGVSQNNLIGKAISGNLGVIGKQVQAKAIVDASENRKEATLGSAATRAGATRDAAATRAGATILAANAPPKTGSMAEAAAARTALGDKKLQLAANQAILKDDFATKEDKAKARQNIAALQGQGAAAPAGRITPEAFQAKWATLKPNQTLVGPDGVTYTKK